MAGTVLTNKGLDLITKLVAAKATLSFTRVAVGTGSVPSGTDPQNMIELNAYKMDATIESYGVSSDQADVAYVTAQVSSVGVDAGFAVTETGVFATDPDEGEILYAYLDLTDDPQYIYAETDAISKFAEITLNVLIGSVESVTAIISPGALVKKADFDALEERVSNIEIPEFDDSGSVSGITNFTEFLATLVSGMNFFNFFRNLKAGFQFVLHVGQLVSNTSTNNANLPASAAAVYQNAQAIASLNTEIQGLSNLKINKVPNGDLNNCYNIAGFSLHVFTSSDNHIPFSATGYVMTFNYDFNSRMQIAFELMTKTATLYKRENTLDWDAYN